MKKKNEHLIDKELIELCEYVRELVDTGNYEECIAPICQAMERYPHAPQPHNLLGIVLEKMGDHVSAMKHFRAAWALDLTYLPATHNLHTYGTVFSNGVCAFDESDIKELPLEQGYRVTAINEDQEGCVRLSTIKGLTVIHGNGTKPYILDEAGCTLTEAMFDFASSLSTVGLSIGITGPMTNDATLIVEMVGMLLGRLEIFIVVIGFTFGFGKVKSLFRRKKRA